MSNNSNDIGRAYEYIWLRILHDRLPNSTIAFNSSLEANERAWNSMPDEIREKLIASVDATVDTLLGLEPNLENNITLIAQRDENGESGDVRDIVAFDSNINWEVGFSIKHNHEAIKHSRLSRTIDFGDKWYGIPCSEFYWEEVNVVFDYLDELKRQRKAWNQLETKEHTVYAPLLQAFMEEVDRAYKRDNQISRRMIEYLIGIKDYHKIVSQDNKRLTIIETFNINGTLGQPSDRRISIIDIPVVDLPDEIVNIRFKPGSVTTAEIYFNKGWQLSFRIHNASTMVEPSLKFDIQFVGRPISIFTIKCEWK